jgi:hypothetical protein
MMTDPSDTFGFVIAPEFDMLPPERLAIEHEYVKRVDPPPDGGVVSDVTSGVVSDVTSSVVSDVDPVVSVVVSVVVDSSGTTNR